jgi:hypothetical protein
VKLQAQGGANFHIDDRDSDLTAFKWKIDRDGYAYRRYRSRDQCIHREVMTRKLGRDLEANERVDHIDRDKTNNRRENLRLATVAENSRNRGPTIRNKLGRKGVSTTPGGRFAVQICVDYERVIIGVYPTADEAAWMYDQWSLALHGEFSYTNFEYN